MPKKAADANKSSKTNKNAAMRKEIKCGDEKIDRSVKSQDKTCELNNSKSSERKNANKRKILFVGSEAFPFAGTGGLGEVLGSLPRAINDSGEYEARVILPLYESFPQNRRKDLEFVCWTFVNLSWRNQYCGLFR
ncbi:MAG: glycogen/starch synthase, partial [Clostridiales bacterium]|nr:glycogen/starch synthase [Clostridiales bacterium]